MMGAALVRHRDAQGRGVLPAGDEVPLLVVAVLGKHLESLWVLSTEVLSSSEAIHDGIRPPALRIVHYQEEPRDAMVGQALV